MAQQAEHGDEGAERAGAARTRLKRFFSRHRNATAATAVVLVLLWAAPALFTAWRTVSTDDAYVDGRVTFVAPRVVGQVARVLVDDDNRVHKGDVLVQLDREPYQVKVDIARSAVDIARANLVLTQARTRGEIGEARSLRFGLERAIDAVTDQVAQLRSKVAVLRSEEASVARAQADYDRGAGLIRSEAISREELDRRKERLLVSQARAEEARQSVYEIRAALGLKARPADGHALTDVPPDLDQTASSVREAQAKLMDAAAELGLTFSYDKSPQQMIADFYARDPHGDIDRIYGQILKNAPAVKVAETELAKAERSLTQAELDLRYCDVVAEIDGVITRREVNPGNNVVVGQGLMAIRSLTDIWIDANFKETQLADLRIGQPVDIDVDMYGNRHRFRGRVSGLTMGTGSTLALLPPENATGNFVKVVQRLPVRIDIDDYDPDRTPLFIGLSVTPRVWIHQTPTGPGAGRILQPYHRDATDPPPETHP